MRTDITCALNGIGLDELDSRIYVEDIKESTKVAQDTMQRAYGGLFPLNEPGRESTVITVQFMMKIRDRAERSEVIQRIRGWAAQGWFTMNTRPGQRIWVYCTKEAEYGAFDRSARCEIEFTAYGEACWQNITPVSVSGTAAVGTTTAEITPDGTRKAYLEAEITPPSGTLTAVSVSIGGKSITLNGLSVTNAAPLVIRYDELQILHIESGGVSQLSKRSAASADDLMLEAGQKNTVTLTVDRACAYAIRARGLWK